MSSGALDGTTLPAASGISEPGKPAVTPPPKAPEDSADLPPECHGIVTTNTTPGSTTYMRAASIESGGVYVIVAGSSDYALTNTSGSTTSRASVTISSNTITSNVTNAMRWTFTANSGNSTTATIRGNSNEQTTGNGDDETRSGDKVSRVRYYNNSWQYQNAAGGAWNKEDLRVESSGGTDLTSGYESIVEYVDGTFTIGPAPVTVKADDKSKTFGEGDPTLTATVTGVIDDDPFVFNYTLSCASGEDVGTYTITPAGDELQGSYTVTCETSTFTITSGEGGGNPVIEIPDEETSLAPVPEDLNGEDHFAYFIGYPDGSVRPSANITRAEVAAIFFRLLKDNVREQYVTKSNDFTDASEGAWYYLAVHEATNSRDYEIKDSTAGFEKWKALRETRNWAELER